MLVIELHALFGVTPFGRPDGATALAHALNRGKICIFPSTAVALLAVFAALQGRPTRGKAVASCLTCQSVPGAAVT